MLQATSRCNGMLATAPTSNVGRCVWRVGGWGWEARGGSGRRRHIARQRPTSGQNSRPALPQDSRYPTHPARVSHTDSRPGLESLIVAYPSQL
eukprot:scaffold2600_cov103-Isochrysis_galbana.AAC.11